VESAAKVSFSSSDRWLGAALVVRLIERAERQLGAMCVLVCGSGVTWDTLLGARRVRFPPPPLGEGWH
jgi:hypothetical protein